jgi:serine/threonine protein kinase
MRFASGARLGPFEILAPLGAGGMGEVYRARDTRLDRPVAMKLLPRELLDTPRRSDGVCRRRHRRSARAPCHPPGSHVFNHDGSVTTLEEWFDHRGSPSASSLVKVKLAPHQT